MIPLMKSLEAKSRASLGNGTLSRTIVRAGLAFALNWGACIALVMAPQAQAATSSVSQTPQPKEKPELVFSTNPMILLDVETGKVLYHKDANRKWYPASLTKLMTAYVAFRTIAAGDLSQDSAVTISKHALSYPPSKMGFKVGTKLTVDNALKMIIVKSANDIAAALGERIAGSEAAFAQLMNREAARLGMTSTHFVNANGWYAAEQTSSARDMGILARQILLEFPQYRDLFQIPAIRHGKQVLRSYNKLLETFRGANGMKTGFVCSSGYNIVASASRGGRQLVAVVLGAPNVQIRSETAAYLLSQGFSRADFATGAGVPVYEARYFGATAPAFDMRPEICGTGGPKWVGHVDYKQTYLDPRFQLMDPVRVYAGLPKREVKLPSQLAYLPSSGPRGKAEQSHAGGPGAASSPSVGGAGAIGGGLNFSQLPRPKP